MTGFTFDVYLNILTEIERQGRDHPIGQMPGVDEATLISLDLGSLIPRLRRVRDAMTQDERADPAAVGADRRARIASESGFPLRDLERLVRAFQMPRPSPGSPTDLIAWKLLGLSRFRPPGLA